jgi:hypothetical protein
MKKIIFLALILISTFSLDAQEAQNIADLDFLYKSIKALPSYKDQLKNDQSYRQLYERLRKDLNTSNDFETYQKLLQLIYPIKDNHLSFHRTPDSSYKFSSLKPTLNIQELEAKYKAYSKDSLEGFYYKGKRTHKYVVFKHSKDTYYLQNLTSGLVEVILNQSNTGSMNAIYFTVPSVPYVLLRNVKFSSGNLIGLGYQKLLLTNYSLLDPGANLYEYKKLNSDIGYLRLSSFNSSDQNIKVATDFFNRVRPNITVQTLIVDLRNNYGGYYKTSGQFIAFLKKYKGKICLLQNGYTISNAEQFIIDLKDNKNVTTLGETTKGTITYGSNMSKTIRLPSKRFLFYPTDMNGRAKDLAYESIGIKPDVRLDAFSEDWITQTLNYIKKNQP